MLLIDKNIVNSIDGATALKLDESYEIKSSEEQNTLINDFESSEEKILDDEMVQKNFNDEIPTGVSIESASYIEKNDNNNSAELVSQDSKSIIGEIEDEYTPKLFSEEHKTTHVTYEIKMYM